ncbi:MAG: DNA-binding transcriptional regulator, LysR family, partial [Hymenobacter sp.]|nr:DNA-binding transcriptional regulator, LysR family [Hymenobacter sp.]
SAISKRIQELEAKFVVELFDRSQRSARLTEKGEQLFQIAKELLDRRDLAIEEFSRPEVVQRRIRLGVTELTAMTWLPRLVRLIQDFYPKVVIEPDIDLSMGLRDKLLADELDLIVVPNSVQDSRFSAKPIAQVESAWMCSPSLMNTSQPVRVNELAKYRLLVQGEKSGTGIFYNQWFKSLGIELPSVIRSNNMIALIGMTVAGLGISYLPRRCLSGLIANGSLAVLQVTPALPKVEYVAMYRGEMHGSLLASIVLLAQSCADFSVMFQSQEADSSPASPEPQN